MKLLPQGPAAFVACLPFLAFAQTASAQVAVPTGQTAVSADQPLAGVISSTAAAEQGSIVEVWNANEGATLSDTLASWGQRAGWKVIWESDSDFHLAASGQFEGSFQKAAERLIEAFGRTRPRLRATFYEGNSVLRVWAERAEP